MNWYLAVVRDNYLNFKGRARRKEYWMFYLYYIFFSILSLFLDFMLGTQFAEEGQRGGGGYISALFTISHLMPILALTVRRLHDTGKSGYWAFYPLGCILLGIIGLFAIDYNLILGMIVGGIAFIGLIIINFTIIVFMFLDSHKGENKYGISPKYGMQGENEDED